LNQAIWNVNLLRSIQHRIFLKILIKNKREETTWSFHHLQSEYRSTWLCKSEVYVQIYTWSKSIAGHVKPIDWDLSCEKIPEKWPPSCTNSEHTYSRK
jgi:hypothetical protein